MCVPWRVVSVRVVTRRRFVYRLLRFSAKTVQLATSILYKHDVCPI